PAAGAGDAVGAGAPAAGAGAAAAGTMGADGAGVVVGALGGLGLLTRRGSTGRTEAGLGKEAAAGSVGLPAPAGILC
ncbi:MAG: hypothetical protein ACRDY2_11830, partial [Acidimicrobiales bacterium]